MVELEQAVVVSSVLGGGCVVTAAGCGNRSRVSVVHVARVVEHHSGVFVVVGRSERVLFDEDPGELAGGWVFADPCPGSQVAACSHGDQACGMVEVVETGCLCCDHVNIIRGLDGPVKPDEDLFEEVVDQLGARLDERIPGRVAPRELHGRPYCCYPGFLPGEQFH